MLETLQQVLIDHPILAPALFVLIRIIPIVIAPIPGLVFDFVGVAVFGWLQGFILAETAVLLGTTIAFYIGRIFREPAVRRFTSLEKVDAWREKYSEDQQFWFLVFARALTSPVFDFVSYAAGLTNISYKKYILITFTASAPLALSFYYIGDSSFSHGVWFSLGLFVVIFLGMYVSKFFFKNN